MGTACSGLPFGPRNKDPWLHNSQTKIPIPHPGPSQTTSLNVASKGTWVTSLWTIGEEWPRCTCLGEQGVEEGLPVLSGVSHTQRWDTKGAGPKFCGSRLFSRYTYLSRRLENNLSLFPRFITFKYLDIGNRSFHFYSCFRFHEY